MPEPIPSSNHRESHGFESQLPSPHITPHITSHVRGDNTISKTYTLLRHTGHKNYTFAFFHILNSEDVNTSPYKRDPRELFTPSNMWGHSEKAVCGLQPGRGPYPDSIAFAP